LTAYATTEDKRGNFRRQISFGTRGGIHSVFKDQHENTVGISMQNIGQKNLFKPARYNRDKVEG